MIAVVLDRRRARFFDLSNDSIAELRGLRSPATGGGRYHSDRADSPGRGERSFHNRRAEEERRHYERVANRLTALVDRHRHDTIVVGGPGPTAATFQRSLPPDVARLVIGTTHLNPVHVSLAAVHVAARAAAERHMLENERKLLDAALAKGLRRLEVV